MTVAPELLKLPMVLFSCFAVGVMRVQYVVKKTEVYRFATGIDPRHPFFADAVPDNPFVSACIVTLLRAVAKVLGLGCLPKIIPAVVQRVAIFVIDESDGPFSRHIDPGETMGEILTAVQANDQSPGSGAARWPAGEIFLPPPGFRPRLPCEHAGFGVVVDQGTDVFGGNVVAEIARACFRLVSHCEFPSLRLGPGSSATNALPSRYFMGAAA